MASAEAEAITAIAAFSPSVRLKPMQSDIGSTFLSSRESSSKHAFLSRVVALTVHVASSMTPLVPTVSCRAGSRTSPSPPPPGLAAVYSLDGQTWWEHPDDPFEPDEESDGGVRAQGSHEGPGGGGGGRRSDDKGGDVREAE